MYLEHFGLDEPPFRLTPVTEFFFSGAHRGEILDALIYSLNEAEGIIKVSGEVGSGKTMLCRMLLERLPGHIEAIYLPNPSLSREEMLHAIADALELGIGGERIGIVMQRIQNRLEEKAREGKRVVVLVDEAHAMPTDTLEELRLLYNLQTGNSKLLQIVLFGQPELNDKLNQPNMRQLKDRIVHHFNMQPLSRDILENYLMFRMRAAGYRGPNIFSHDAIKLIAAASNGLMRRVNILADKSLLSAFIENTHHIEARHVRAAMRDSELLPRSPLMNKKLLLAGAAAVMLLGGLAVWQTTGNRTETSNQKTEEVVTVHPAIPVAARPQAASPSAARGDAAAQPSLAAPAPPASPQKAAANNAAKTATPAPAMESGTTTKPSRVEQRMAAGRQLLAQKKAVASIQLFCGENSGTAHIEDFLKHAATSGRLSKIYLLPRESGSTNGLCVLYGAYPSMEAARTAVNDLPARYQEEFATSIYIF